MWVMEDHDPTTMKLYIKTSSDADDLLQEAAASTNFTIKQPKSYDVKLNDELLRRDVKLETMKSSLDRLFVIVQKPWPIEQTSLRGCK